MHARTRTRGDLKLKNNIEISKKKDIKREGAGVSSIEREKYREKKSTETGAVEFVATGG